MDGTINSGHEVERVMTEQSTSNDMRSLAEIEKDLRSAEAAYLEAEARVSQAERDRSAALKLLNTHQSEFDESVLVLRARSIPVSKWGDKRSGINDVLDLQNDQVAEGTPEIGQKGAIIAAAEFDRLRANLKSSENPLVKVRLS
ncbi:MAG: hypothetical protein KGM93_16410 [Sphingomonadales bacterium]|nr:hypothetical protein [Sphingomonadales bacterium]